MMKRIVVFVLCVTMALSTVAFGGELPKKDTAARKTLIGIPNPFVDCKTLEQAEKLAGFKITFPKKIPAGYQKKSIRAIKNEMIEIIYQSKANKICIRKAKGNKDISGDYNVYQEKKSVQIGALKVTTKGNGGKVSVAIWNAGDYAYAIIADNGGKGIDRKVVNDMIKSMGITVSNANSSQIPNPFIPCSTIDKAAQIAGFEVTLPEKMPDGFTQKAILAIKDNMIEIDYSNGNAKLYIRKAKGSEEISGDYNEYQEKNTLQVGALRVTTKGSDGRINVATWNDGDYSYAIGANDGEKGLDASVVSDMIKSIQ